MTWLPGRALMKRLEENPPMEERNIYAAGLFRAWYQPLYNFGVIHGDPHLGNYLVRKPEGDDAGGINLLDFGTIRVFAPHFIGGVTRLFEAVRDHDEEKARHAFEEWGFRDLSKEMMGHLKRWAEFLYEPLIDDRVHHRLPIERKAEA